MNRREFMTRFGMAAMAAGVAPSLMGLAEQPRSVADNRAWNVQNEEQEVPRVIAPTEDGVEILSLQTEADYTARDSARYVIQLRRPDRPFDVVYETHANVLTPFLLLFPPGLRPMGRVEVVCTRDVPWCLMYRSHGGPVKFIAGGLRT
jgi:hypothetical protein